MSSSNPPLEAEPFRGAPHDGLFRYVFRQPGHAAAALRTWLPPEVVARLDLSRLVRLDPVAGSVRLRERRADLVFETRLADRPALVQLLVEHQSTVDRDMALRLFGLAGELWSDWRRRHVQGPLPLILPCVVYHGRRRWTAPLHLQGLMAVGPGMADRPLRAVLPELRYHLDDLRATSERALRQRPWPALPLLAALLLKHAHPEANLARAMGRWRDLVRRVVAGADRPAWPALIRYLLTATATPPEALADELGDALPGELEETIMTTASRLIEQGIELGIERGIEQGIERGIEQGIERGRAGLCRSLLTLLQLRFGGAPSAAVVARVEAADLASLERWTKRVLDAPTAEAVVAD